MKKEVNGTGKRKVRFADEITEKSDVIDDMKARDPVGEDITKLVAELTPGKRGGDFPLPFGGNLSVQQGTFGKRDVITCCQVSPSDRYKYTPPLTSEEKLVSELFLLGCNTKSLRKTVSLQLPVYEEDLELFQLTLLAKKTDGMDWENIPFQLLENNRMVALEAEHTGIYCLVSAPRREEFDVPVQGCLYNARIHKNITVRFPKKATDVDIKCCIQIIRMNEESLAALRQEFPGEMMDLVVASDFYDIRPSIQKDFRRAATIKLPLPPLEGEEYSEEDLVVMEMTPDGWQLFEAPLKLTKATVSFDTKKLSRYCIALSRPQRKRRLREAFKHILQDNDVTRGEVLPFIHFRDKSWTVWFDCVPISKVDDCINQRLQQGFQQIKKTEVIDEEEDKPVFRRHWKARAKTSEPVKPKRQELDLINACSFDLAVGGDIRICNDDPGQNYTYLQFHEKLPGNYRKFRIEPLPVDPEKGETDITAILQCYTVDFGTSEKSTCVRTFHFHIESETVKKYFYVEPEPEPEPEPIKEPEEVIEEKPVEAPPPPPSPRPTRFTTPMTTSFMRLIRPTKPPRKISRESKVLTGRSLMSIAREVEQGLTLAIYLDISDSCITGMGFDALATGLSLVDITYRILLLWKRRTSRLKDQQVDVLASALQEMGRNDVAAVLLDKHRENAEITPDCFTAH